RLAGTAVSGNRLSGIARHGQRGGSGTARANDSRAPTSGGACARRALVGTAFRPGRTPRDRAARIGERGPRLGEARTGPILGLAAARGTLRSRFRMAGRQPDHARLTPFGA